MNINTLWTDNVLVTQKFLQELPENKKLNLSEEQKNAFSEALAQTLSDNSNIKDLADKQKISLLNDSKISSITDLYSKDGYLNLLATKLDKNNNLTTTQKQLLNSLGATSKDSISSSSNILMDALANSTLKENKVTNKSHVENNHAVKAKAKSSYQQQIPANLSANMGEMTSRIGQIRSNFFA